jgi:two-component system response regulator PilR (NtrC family)
LLGESKSVHKLHSQIKKVALSQAPIYISGESGSGKEVAARMIHALGARSDNAFMPVNCGAIPDELMESEFFGHKKGSFTGAIADKEGLFQSADGGTLFLDEVADLPMHMQVKLLRAIQEKAIRPIGAQQEIPVDVRILSATHKNLAAEVDAGNFRQDMFYRINVIELKIPSLRERREDIPLLSDHFLQRLSEDSGLTAATLSNDALGALEAYSFPGNVRELENILERAYTLCEDNRIEEGDLQLSSAASATSATETCQPILNEALSGEGLSSDSLDDYLEEIEKQAILKALEETRWNRTAAAEKLGISFRQMRHRLKKFGID